MLSSGNTVSSSNNPVLYPLTDNDSNIVVLIFTFVLKMLETLPKQLFAGIYEYRELTGARRCCDRAGQDRTAGV